MGSWLYEHETSAFQMPLFQVCYVTDTTIHRFRGLQAYATTQFRQSQGYTHLFSNILFLYCTRREFLRESVTLDVMISWRLGYLK